MNWKKLTILAIILSVISFFIGWKIAETNLIELSEIQILIIFLFALFLIILAIAMHFKLKRKVKKK